MAKGQKTGGRVKGTPNRVTATVKEALQAAFDEVGGKDYLVRMATQEPRAFCALIGKVIPQDINATIGADDNLKALLGALDGRTRGLPKSA
jgi:hypothetical protein